MFSFTTCYVVGLPNAVQVGRKSTIDCVLKSNSYVYNIINLKIMTKYLWEISFKF